jgi:predicted metalloprotease
MRYNPRARLDRSQVERRSGGGGGFAGGTGIKVGGGIGGLVVLVLVLLLQSQLGGPDSSPGASDGGTSSSSGGTSLDRCRTGADANQDEDCAIVADVNSIQSFWTEELPRQSGRRYAEARTTLFTGSAQSGCGAASADVGPFYCPADDHVYLDTTFFRDMLQGRLGARGGPFARAYVLAHEYGHHVQDLLGTTGRGGSATGATSGSVRLELQADCYAGIWTRHATTAHDAGGRPLIADLTRDDVSRALDAAAAVGDDRIQRTTTGQVDPDAWTHGSAAERMRWFSIGVDRGTLKACDTFSAQHL